MKINVMFNKLLYSYVKGFNATYELTYEVMGIIQQGLEAHILANANED
jgi:hypothetical protein